MIKQRVQRMALRGGSTLVWVMVVILVLVVVLGIGLTATSSRFGLSVTRHEQQQAYYTALSSTNTIADWLTTSTADNAKKEKAEKLLGTIPGPGDNPNNIDITEDGLPAEVGTCTVNLRYVDSKKSTLKIASTAVFAGVSETVSLTLTREEASGYSPGADLAVSNYDGTKYDKRADELKAIKSTGIVAIYDSNEKDNTGYNETDKTLLNSYIKTTTSTYEARWTNSDLTKKPSTTDSGNSSETNNSNVLGTETYPANSSSSSNNKNDTRRFMVPINGRITIDPLERDGHEGSASSPHSSATSGDNTRVVGLAISNTAGKNVLFRLASGAASTSPGLLNKTGTFYDWSAKRYASLITLNFTDNAKSTEANNTENLKYTVPGRSQETYPWHPDKWASMDFLVRSNDSVTTNLVLGPFAHKYQIALDRNGYGNFVDNWHGTTAGELRRQWPDLTNKGHLDGQGLPYFPVDFGKNASFWILDGNSSGYYFRVMQGVNILNGTIYSTRPTIIGGALIRTKDDYTSDNLNRKLNGFVDKDPDDYALYVEATTRYNQLIYNTDIVLKGPSPGTTSSTIRRPQTWQDRTFETSKITAKDKTFDPTMTIKGGTIYVGERQSLTIEGSVINNMWINPDSIVVAKGGTLTINSSYYTNVITNIYVDGGTLNINSGARIKGNIYVYNAGAYSSGIVNIKGSFNLDSPTTVSPEKNGLFVFGPELVGVGVGARASELSEINEPSTLSEKIITAPGRVATTSTAPTISGTSGRVHLVGGDWTTSVSGTTTAVANASNFLCPGYDKKSGRCQHHGEEGSPGGWTIGSYSDR